MKVFLKELTFSGIKNIKEKLTISFGKKNVQRKEELSDYNIKSIYGPNGAGKTAIVHALYIFKNLMSNPNYLNETSNNDYLKELLNKQSNVIDLKLEFYYFKDREKPVIYIYNIKLKKGDKFIIEEEYYAYKRNEYSVEQVIFHSVEENLISYSFSGESKKRTYNLLKERTIASIIFNFITDNLNKDNLEIIKEDLNLITPLFEMADDLLIILDKEDLYLNLKNKNISFFNSLKELLSEVEKDSVFKNLPMGRNVVTKKELETLQKEVDNKAMFVKLFKPDIKSIDLEITTLREENELSLYEVESFLNYGDYKINFEYESMGIKKIFKLYDYFKDLTNGKIVVIDELDSHINDIFLTKMLEYTYEHAKGQLIFTSHSITPMETLKTGKNAIDFISISGKITSWKQIGNYSPTNLYKLGMIDGLPFNIWPESLMKVFVDEE